MSRRALAYLLFAAVLLELIVLGIVYQQIPRIRRPFEVMMAVVAGFSLLEMFLVRRNWARSLLLAMASVALTIFALEWGQKYFGIMKYLDGNRTASAMTAGDYPWRLNDGASYLEARKKAAAAGIVPKEQEERRAGEVFSAEEKSALLTDVFVTGPGGAMKIITEALKPYHVSAAPLGFELNPGNKVRTRLFDLPTEQLLLDYLVTVTPHGFRETRGTDASGNTYLFIGCSFTFGVGLNDDETWPYFFSETNGFADRIVNLGVRGFGPHQALRDLELNYHLSRAGVADGTVRKVFYGLIDDHPNRLFWTQDFLAPCYRLENGKAVYKGLNRDVVSRFRIMMEKSRIYPLLAKRLSNPDTEGKWRLTVAILAEMHRLCLERYGVPLTVVYWDENPEAIAMIRNAGMELVLLSEVLGKDWRKNYIRYFLYEGHPGVVLNRELGRYLHAFTAGKTTPAGAGDQGKQ